MPPKLNDITQKQLNISNENRIDHFYAIEEYKQTISTLKVFDYIVSFIYYLIRTKMKHLKLILIKWDKLLFLWCKIMWQSSLFVLIIIDFDKQEKKRQKDFEKQYEYWSYYDCSSRSAIYGTMGQGHQVY